MIQEEVVCPFVVKVVGEFVEIEGFDFAGDSSRVAALCRRNSKKYEVDISSLQWDKTPPKGFEWIEAYKAWLKGQA